MLTRRGRPRLLLLLGALVVVVGAAVALAVPALRDASGERRTVTVSAAVADAGLPADVVADASLTPCRTDVYVVLCGWSDLPAREAVDAVVAHLGPAGVEVDEVVCEDPGRDPAGTHGCAASMVVGDAALEVRALDTVGAADVPLGATAVAVHWTSVEELPTATHEHLQWMPPASAGLDPASVTSPGQVDALPERYGDLPPFEVSVPRFRGDVVLDGLEGADGAPQDVLAAVVRELTDHGFLVDSVTPGPPLTVNASLQIGEGAVSVVVLLDREAGAAATAGVTVVPLPGLSGPPGPEG